jgi:hypothetical protein
MLTDGSEELQWEERFKLSAISIQPSKFPPLCQGRPIDLPWPLLIKEGWNRSFCFLDRSPEAVYESAMVSFHVKPWLPSFLTYAVVLPWTTAGSITLAEDLPITPNTSISDFQIRQEDVKPYDFNAPPQGMFRSITMSEGFEEELGFRRTHEIVPIKPTDRFRPDSLAVYVVFALHQHYQAFKVFGRCFPEEVTGLDPETAVGEDSMYIALEDESGYLKLFPPQGGWKPGRYKVEIHAGEQVNDVSLVGTMRFTVGAAEAATAK